MSDTLPIRHIARALVFDPDDRLLLIAYQSVRDRAPDGTPKVFWFMPGGGLEAGESHVEACRRELSEEIGREAEIGPQIGVCDGPFRLFKQARDARERYFLVRLPNAEVDTSRLAETEDNPLLGTRWWTMDELRATEEHIEPAGLADLARDVTAGMIPDAPVVLSWRGA